MSGTSSIEWTEATWNPVVGCSHVSPGCDHCYAEELHRTRLDGQGVYPDFRPWTAENAEHNVTLVPERLDQPSRWRTPRMVFVNSMSDMFHPRVPSDFIARVFDTMARCPQHTFQVLTKRPKRMRSWCERYRPEPLPNVWLGTSIENRRYVHRADLLRETPAAVRFVSAEPLLGPLLNYRDGCPSTVWDGPYKMRCSLGGDGTVCARHGRFEKELDREMSLDLDGIDWLICGGESGPKCRPFNLDWARDLRDACEASGTAFFLKQLGGHPDKCGGEKALLDGRRHVEMPTSLVVA